MYLSILPETAINILPFSEEPLSQWKQETDISQFLDALHAGTIYASYGQYLYEEGKKKFRALSKQFNEYAQEALRAPAAATQTLNIPNFLEDATFGKAAKYVIAWEGCVSDLLAESAFYSLAHILESDTEIQCSLLLASHLYYKQALQVLRNFIEKLILPINFCENMQEFDQWKANNYCTPSLRGRDGLIKKLVDKQILSNSMANEVSGLYGDLNSYIHGSENRLIHKNAHRGTWNGLIFKYKDLCDWAEYLSSSINLGIKLLRINYLQWERILSSKWNSLRLQGKVLCSTCHNEDDFEVSILPPEDADYDIEIFTAEGQIIKVDRTYSGATFHVYHCRRCGSETTVQAL